MDLHRLIRSLASQRVKRFKTAFFNISEMIRDLEASHKKELLQVLSELQNGNYTFEYSFTGLSRNIQARLKQIHFGRKNIFSNVSMFMSYFTPKSLAEMIAEDVILEIMQLLHMLTKEQFTNVKVFFVVDGKQTPQQLYAAQARQQAQAVWIKAHQRITKQFASQIKRSHLHVDQYAPGIYADKSHTLRLILDKARELVAIAQQSSEPSADVFTRVIKGIQILDENSGVLGPAKRYIPHYIEKNHAEQSDSVLVFDPSQDSLMLQLTCGLKQSLYMEGRFVQMEEARAILQTLFKIPPEQCRAVGWLYAASRLESMPAVSTIGLSGAHPAVHCYVYGKYMTKQWTRSFDPAHMDAMLLNYLAAYGAVQRLIDNSRVNPLLYQNLGGILIFSNKKTSGIPRELRLPKVSIRSSQFDHAGTPYTKQLQQIYLLADNKHVQEEELDLAPSDASHYVHQCIQEVSMQTGEPRVVWTARAPLPRECVQRTGIVVSHCVHIQHPQTVSCSVDIESVVDAIVSGGLAVKNLRGIHTLEQINLCSAKAL